jgi:hypothetical protein
VENIPLPSRQATRPTFAVTRWGDKLTMVTSSSGALVELEAEIVELEEEILDRATRDRLLAIPKKLFTEAQDYHRKGNAREARLTINCACRLVERAKNEFKK